MKKFCLMFCLVFLALFAFGDNAVWMPKPFAFGLPSQTWWRVRMNQEEFRWVDHTCKTNTSIRPLLISEGEQRASTRVGGGNGIHAEIGPDFRVLSYTIESARLNETNYSYDINRIAPGTYDLINGKWYPEMTDEEKHAKWAAYTNQVIQGIIADIKERKAPAKFDVSKTPGEYRAWLMGGRDPETLTPEEEREINIEYNIYRLEWTRVNDPDHYKRIPLPRDTILTERQKKDRLDRSENIRQTLRSRRMFRSMKKK